MDLESLESLESLECSICWLKVQPVWKTVITRCCSLGIFCYECYIRLNECPQCRTINGFEQNTSQLFGFIDNNLISSIKLNNYITESNVISIIDHMINRNSLNVRDLNGNQLLHYLSIDRNYADSIIYLLDLGLNSGGNSNWHLNLEDINTGGWLPIHLICKYQTERVCQKILDIYQDFNLNLEISMPDGSAPSALHWQPIHIICCCQTEVICQRILDIYIDKGLDLEAKIDNGWMPIHCICCFQTEAVCLKILDIYQELNLDLEVRTNDGELPIELIYEFQTETVRQRINSIYENRGLATSN